MVNSFLYTYTTNTCYKEVNKVTSEEIPLHQDPTVKIQIKRHFAEEP